ncbi:CobW family GTP-binding protein [Filibacter tadaridae]|uniref:Putative GTP-binding protein YjiA n=1 Tax=Filibacter tadaridae TaxID=2483811 RepID=A0A3P5XCD0_9BACL|nr:CobW family GTP-binding protein [Filibacter tadaridae]VDC28992.1 putative GTP-binding protein YjiA [Filibacter tadaridae]
MIDVYLFSGFLGSGKTSLLLHTIKQLKEQGKNPAVLMNEFGALPFDSDTVKGQDEVPLKELLDGCICCTGSEKTEAQLQGLLEENNDIDVILIETTGAAHPVEALDAIYSPLFADKLLVRGIVTVADSKRWLGRHTLSPQIRALFLEQIRHAHIILANKADLLTESEMATVTLELSNLNNSAPIIQTTDAKIAFSYIEKVLSESQNKIDKPIVSGKNLSLSTKLLTFTESVDQDEFEDWVKSLPDTIYRMKGYVPVRGVKHPYLFQYAYGMVNWLPEYVMMEPRLVVIGEGLDGLVYKHSNASE